MGEAANTHDHKLCQQTFKSSMSDYDVTPIAGRSVLHVHAHSTVSNSKVSFDVSTKVILSFTGGYVTAWQRLYCPCNIPFLICPLLPY